MLVNIVWIIKIQFKILGGCVSTEVNFGALGTLLDTEITWK